MLDLLYIIDNISSNGLMSSTDLLFSSGSDPFPSNRLVELEDNVVHIILNWVFVTKIKN